MATEIFTKQQFEAALPVDRETGERVWEEVSFGTEYTYAIPVTDTVVLRHPATGADTDTAEETRAVILVQSSIIRGQSQCGGTGENSIRAWLVNANNMQDPLAPKVVRWTARTKNWRVNMTNQLRELYKIGLLLGDCPKCGAALKVRTSHSSANPDRHYIICSKSARGKSCYWGGWLDEKIGDGDHAKATA